MGHVDLHSYTPCHAGYDRRLCIKSPVSDRWQVTRQKTKSRYIIDVRTDHVHMHTTYIIALLPGGEIFACAVRIKRARDIIGFMKI